ncbi:MAG: MutS-related protein [Methanobacteriota archaeon]
MKLEAIPGVGAKTAAALRELDDPAATVESGDVAAIARAPGVNEARATRIARGAIRRRHDDDGRVLATDRARELYREAIGLLRERTVTDYAAKRLETFYPSASASRIAEAQSFAADATKREPDPAVREALADCAPLSAPPTVRVRDRCLATADAETLARAEAELGDVAGVGLDVEGDVSVRPDALETPAETVPERLLAFFAENRERLEAAAAVHEAAAATGDPVSGGDGDAAPPVEVGRLRDALSRLDDDGTIAGDAELDRLTAAVDDLDAAVSTAASVADDRLREAIRERDVTIEGTDFLSLVEQGARVDSLLDRELADEYDDAIDAAREHLAEALRLKPEETELAERVFGGDPSFPVHHDESAVSRLRTELSAARDRRAAKLKADLASDLGDLREPVEQLVRDALELDVKLAIARFARDFDCAMPEVVDPDSSDSGFRIERGRSPLLDVDFAEVEPVDYAVSGATLLSGVNSGGKTSTLDLVALVVVLAQMGLPVPAESATVERFEEIHYYAKSQGTLDAGAFEATLRDFGDLVDGADGRLVLVDELESITEPGASAKIIAGILEALDEQDVTAVFVSHLAREIRDTADFAVAVDGIEAAGLVDGELRVNRSPKKGHLARSTPELIVEKLADDRGGEFYGDLLEKF